MVVRIARDVLYNNFTESLCPWVGPYTVFIGPALYFGAKEEQPMPILIGAMGFIAAILLLYYVVLLMRGDRQ